MYLMPQGLKALQTARWTTHQERFQRLIMQCRRYEKELLPAEHPLKSITYYGMAAANLSLAYLLTNQKQYLFEARRWINAGVQYPHWGKAVKVDVDLSAAWLLFGYGLSYHWLKDRMEANDRYQLREKLILQGERMYRFARETGAAASAPVTDSEKGVTDVLTGQSWATSYWQNHNWIDLCGLFMTALAICDEYPPAEDWIRLVRCNFDTVFPLLPEDGSDYEGVVYWRYGVIWLFLYAELEREYSGYDWFRESPFLQNTFYYRLYQMGPDREQNFNFGDCHDRHSGHIPCLYFKTAAEYGNGYAKTLGEEVLRNSLALEGYESGVKPGILPEAFLEYLWYDPDVAARPLEELPTQRFFPDLGLLSARTGWDKGAAAFSYKCAPGGGHKQWTKAIEMEKELGIRIRSMGHHHPDANSFMIIRGSDYLAVDEGYSAKKMTRNHNVVIVDGKGYTGDGSYDVYAGQPEEAAASVLAYEPHGKGFYICGESAGVYNPALGMQMMRREIISADAGWYVFIDTCRSAEPRTFTWLLHGDYMPARSPVLARFENGGSALEIYQGDPDARMGTTMMENSANVTSQEPDNIVYTRLFAYCQENKLPASEYTFCTLVTTGSTAAGGMPQASVVRTESGWTVYVDGSTVRTEGNTRTVTTGETAWTAVCPE